MKKYIEKQVVFDELNRLYDECIDNPTRGAITELEDIIKEWPAADVRPVRRGRWEMDSDNIPHCTECGCVAPQRLFLQVKSLACTTQFIMSNYCPDCGSYNGGDSDVV